MLLKIIKYILLGGIQGLTEPLPISSSAHMSLCAIILNLEENNLFFEVLVNFASVLAVCLFLKNDLKCLLKKENFKLIKKLILASIPCGIIGFLIHDKVNNSLNNLSSIAGSLYITTLFLILTSYLLKKESKNEITNFNALTLGIFQSVALIPGISRCGTVLFGGSILKIKKHTILKFSFLMYIIVSTGATLFSFIKGIKNNTIILSTNNLIFYSISFIVCFCTTYISLKWFHKIITRKSLLIFAMYTFILASIILLFWV